MTDTMKAGVLMEPGLIEAKDQPVPSPEPGEALIRVGAAGVCGSDKPRVFESGAHTHPIIIGHEFAGTIESLHPGESQQTELEAGDEVAVYPLLPCHRCSYCESALYNLCEDYSYLGSRQDGAFAEYVTAPIWNLVPLPNVVSLEAGAMTDPAAIALHGIRMSGIEAGDRVAVLGLGPIGMFALQWAQIKGASEVIGVDQFDSVLEVGESLGADRTVNTRETDLTESSIEPFDLIVEITGAPAIQAKTPDLLKPKGSVSLVGISHRELKFSEHQAEQLLRNEISVNGVWNSLTNSLPIDEWRVSLEFMSRGRLRTEPILTHRFRIGQIQEAFSMMREGSEPYTKVMFFPGSG